jgi:hypothetical protein
MSEGCLSVGWLGKVRGRRGEATRQVEENNHMPLSMGGAVVEGRLKITLDKPKGASIMISMLHNLPMWIEIS